MTLRDLARLANVSHPTVSRALHNSPRLSRETRERIQALAKEHGYRPHPLVSKLMAQLPHVKSINRSVLGLITSSIRSPFIQEIDAGVRERADALGYELAEFPLGDQRMSCRRLSDVLYSRGIQGLVILPLQKSPSHLSLKWEHFSSVAIGLSLAQPRLHRVSFSQFENAALALRRLRKLGYARIGVALVEGLRGRGGEAYLAAYLLSQQSIPPADRLPVLIRPRLEPAEVADWLRECRADAILCNYDPTPEELQAEGFEIPVRLGYATLDRHAAPVAVTGIEQHPWSVGAAAIDALTAHLNRNETGIPPYAKLTVIQGEWIQGQTVRKQTPSR